MAEFDAAAPRAGAAGSRGPLGCVGERGRRRRREAADGVEEERKQEGGVLAEEAGPSGSSPRRRRRRLEAGGGAAPCPRTPQRTAADLPAPGAGGSWRRQRRPGRRPPPWRSSNPRPGRRGAAGCGRGGKGCGGAGGAGRGRLLGWAARGRRGALGVAGSAVRAARPGEPTPPLCRRRRLRGRVCARAGRPRPGPRLLLQVSEARAYRWLPAPAGAPPRGRDRGSTLSACWRRRVSWRPPLRVKGGCFFFFFRSRTKLFTVQVPRLVFF